MNTTPDKESTQDYKETNNNLLWLIFLWIFSLYLILSSIMQILGYILFAWPTIPNISLIQLSALLIPIALKLFTIISGSHLARKSAKAMNMLLVIFILEVINLVYTAIIFDFTLSKVFSGISLFYLLMLILIFIFSTLAEKKGILK